MIKSGQRLDLDPRSPDFYQNPYAAYSICRHLPAFYWEQYGMWCVGSFSGVNSVLRDRRFGRVMPDERSPEQTINDDQAPPHLQDFARVEKHSLLNLEPPHHTRLRSLVNHAFIAQAINTLRPDIETLAMQQIDTFRGSGRTDLLSSCAMPVPATIIARLLGVPDQYVPDLLGWSHAMVKVYTLTQTEEDDIRANTAAAEFEALVKRLINERRESPGHDLLSHMIKARVGDESQLDSKLTDSELVSTIVLLLNAGHEATVHQTGNAIKTILEHDYDPADLFKTEAQTDATITELMRYDAPLHLFTRYALSDVTVAGTKLKLKKGEQIGLLLGSANRDPARFAQADIFDPWRKDAGQVSLGAGIHYCIGAVLARLELKILLPMIFQELPSLAFAEPPRYMDAFHFHGLDKLDVKWSPQHQTRP